MKCARFRTVAEFLVRAEGFLVQHEAENNLVLGISSALKLNPNLYGPQVPYLAVVESEGEVMAVAIMTPPHRLILPRVADRQALELIARDVYEFRPDLPGVTGPALASGQFAEAWQALTGQAFHKSTAERIYKLEKVKPPGGVSGQMRRIAQTDQALLKEWLVDYQTEAFGGEVDPEAIESGLKSWFTLPQDFRGTFLWEDSQPVSLVNYSGPTPQGMRIGPVYTPKEFRGRGYASACTAGVSQYLLDSGRKFVFLFTDLANPTSNKIYQQIGYEAVGDVDEYKFGG